MALTALPDAETYWAPPALIAVLLAHGVDVNAKNTKASYGSEESNKMDFSDVDRAPMHALNAIIWRSVKGPDALVPTPVHRFRPLIDASDVKNKDKD